MKVNVNLFTWLKEKKGKKNTQIFFSLFFTMWCWRFQTFGVVLKTRKRCRSVFIVIHVSHSCKTAVWTIKMLLRSLLWFSDFLPPVTSYPAWFRVISMSRDQFAIQAYIGKISKRSSFLFFFKKTTASVSSRCSSKSTKKQTWPKTADTEHGGHPSNWLNSWGASTCRPFILCDSWLWAEFFCFLKFWVQNVSCLCAILGGSEDSGCNSLVKAAWLNLSRAVQQMADFGTWRRCSSFSLPLQL